MNRREFLKTGLEKIIPSSLLIITSKTTKTVAVPNFPMVAVLIIISFAGFNNNCLANEEIFGKLRIETYVDNPNFTRKPHNIVHRNGASEEKDGMDFRYYPKYNLETVIISRIPNYEYELYTDSRPPDSLTPVNLELSLYSSLGMVYMDNENELWCSFPLANTPPYFADFGNKPVTLWEKSIIDPNNNPNDPNNYTISLIADIMTFPPKTVPLVIRVPA